jgi:hypothetical protein
MLYSIIFVFTLGIVILNLLIIIGGIGKDYSPRLPYYGNWAPDYWLIFYPSFFYQVCWWSLYFNLI